MNWSEKEVFITGGCGSLGKVLTKILAKEYKPRGIRLYSRDEYKQWVFRDEVKDWEYKNIAFIIGDTRDYDTVRRAMRGCHIVIHTAAMKQIPACEDNPFEAKTTNVDGAKNIINACLYDCSSVEKVMNISTDKAAYPINLYGMTKATAEKLFIEGNIYSSGKLRKPMFASCRYGNILGSRGSVIQLFREQSKTGEVAVTDKDMTRFWITVEQVARFIISRIESMQGGEIFVPHMPSCSMDDFAKWVAPNCKRKIIGLRRGEKMHETLVTKEESYHSRYEALDGSIIGHWIISDSFPNVGISATPNSESFTSENNAYRLTKDELINLLKEDEDMRGEKWL